LKLRKLTERPTLTAAIGKVDIININNIIDSFHFDDHAILTIVGNIKIAIMVKIPAQRFTI
tara:strand:- start:464 stop:646 length:183 start_codon:yes stop_codon:yes gene_type:complete